MNVTMQSMQLQQGIRMLEEALMQILSRQDVQAAENKGTISKWKMMNMFRE